MPVIHSQGRNLSPLIREWKREYRHRGWSGSPHKLEWVSWKKAKAGKRP